MQVVSLKLRNYLSVQNEDVSLGRLNVLIGTNASGKSNVMDALRFLRDAIRRDFQFAVTSRGGFVHLACKASEAREVHLVTTFRDGDRAFEWSVCLSRREFDFAVREEVSLLREGQPPQQLLKRTEDGAGWWWSGSEGKVQLRERPEGSALAAAAADASFPARAVADFVRGWGFFDPNPGALRRASAESDSSALAGYGQNLAARLHTLKRTDRERFERIHSATRDILGVPEEITFRTFDDGGRVALLFNETGLKYRIHQAGGSSGTLRMLAITTALLGTTRTLIGVEEPENYIHPGALSAFTEHILREEHGAQIVITTHSPQLLDVLDLPEAILLVRRTEGGTKVVGESDPQLVRTALDASGFRLGEWHETKGFGG